MKYLSIPLISLLALMGVLFSPTSFAETVVQNTHGVFVKGAATNIYAPTAICYATDGSGAFIPCREGGLGVSPGYVDTSSTNVTSSAYVNAITSTSDVAKSVSVYNGSTSAMVLAISTGGGAYADKLLISPSGWTPVMKLFIPAGASVGLKSKGATASTGVVLINLVQ